MTRPAIRDAFKRPLSDLRISVTDRCNFRCTYCMPAEVYGERYQFLTRDQLLSFEEIARVARIVAGLGAVKARLTGGEPLVRKRVSDLVRMLAGIDGVEDLTMTTNGYLLPKYADELRVGGAQAGNREPGHPGRCNIQEHERTGLRGGQRP